MSEALVTRARAETTVSEDEELEKVITLRAEGLKADVIAHRTGIHIRRVRWLLGQPAARQAIEEVIAIAAMGAKAKLAEHAEEAADSIAILATVGADGPLDAIRLKAAEALLDRLEPAKASPSTVVQVAVVRGPEAFQALDSALADDEKP